MRTLIPLFLAAAALMAQSLPVTATPVTDDITITVINDWTLPAKALGLDMMETQNGPRVIGINNGTDQIHVWNDGQILESITLPPASTGHSWGLACINQGDTVSELLVNDFDKFDMYLSSDVGVTWGTEDDPGGKFSRGMDYDGTHYWTVINNYTDQLCRFTPGGTGATWDIPEIGGNQQGSGLSVFPLSNGDTGIILALFDSAVFHFYGYNGTDLYHIGQAATPFSSQVLVSFGVAYCETTGHFYWTYGPASGYRMVEFTVDMEGAALSQTTWSSIKTSF